MQPQGTPENGYLWQRVNSQLSSPSQPYSLREALAQAQSSRIGASAQALRESLRPILRQKLVQFWIEKSIACLIAATAPFTPINDYFFCSFIKFHGEWPNESELLTSLLGLTTKFNGGLCSSFYFCFYFLFFIF